MPKLGEVSEQGCYKNGKRVSNAKYLHNCKGDEVQWKFQVLDDNGNVMGHVIAGLDKRYVNKSETDQKKLIRKIALEQLR